MVHVQSIFNCHVWWSECNPCFWLLKLQHSPPIIPLLASGQRGETCGRFHMWEQCLGCLFGSLVEVMEHRPPKRGFTMGCTGCKSRIDGTHMLMLCTMCGENWGWYNVALLRSIGMYIVVIQYWLILIVIYCNGICKGYWGDIVENHGSNQLIHMRWVCLKTGCKHQQK